MQQTHSCSILSHSGISYTAGMFGFRARAKARVGAEPEGCPMESGTLIQSTRLAGSPMNLVGMSQHRNRYIAVGTAQSADTQAAGPGSGKAMGATRWGGASPDVSGFLTSRAMLASTPSAVSSGTADSLPTCSASVTAMGPVTSLPSVRIKAHSVRRSQPKALWFSDCYTIFQSHHHTSRRLSRWKTQSASVHIQPQQWGTSVGRSGMRRP